MKLPKQTLRVQLMRSLEELEQKTSGQLAPAKKPTITISMTNAPTVSKARWESLGRAARNPNLKLKGQAILALE